ncbi:hypothetical protein Hanom_Chr17g01564851 [Helianthus anomalus]
MKMARFQTFWIQMWKNKTLDESRKTDQTSGTKMAFYSSNNNGKLQETEAITLNCSIPRSTP